jgi:hypothetical protein
MAANVATMPSATELADAQFLATVDAMEAPIGHRDNLRLAWLLLRTHDTERAASRMLDIIESRAAHKGGSVHITKTRAWTTILASEQRADPDASFDEFLAERRHLLDHRFALRYYSQERLESDAARTSWVAPDLMQLPD